VAFLLNLQYRSRKDQIIIAEVGGDYKIDIKLRPNIIFFIDIVTNLTLTRYETSRGYPPCLGWHVIIVVYSVQPRYCTLHVDGKRRSLKVSTSVVDRINRPKEYTQRRVITIGSILSGWSFIGMISRLSLYLFISSETQIKIIYHKKCKYIVHVY
jgi:hypothetical protein